MMMSKKDWLLPVALPYTMIMAPVASLALCGAIGISIHVAVLYYFFAGKYWMALAWIVASVLVVVISIVVAIFSNDEESETLKSVQSFAIDAISATAWVVRDIRDLAKPDYPLFDEIREGIANCILMGLAIVAVFIVAVSTGRIVLAVLAASAYALLGFLRALAIITNALRPVGF